MLHLFVCVLYNNPAVSEYMIILFLARKVIIRIFIHEKIANFAHCRSGIR